MELSEAEEELKEVNSQLTLYMRKKRALQSFIEEMCSMTPQKRARELKKDENFIKEYGRERTAKEIARIMNYSERQIQRFLKEEVK